MKTQIKDLYHGVALTQIVEHPSYKALNKASSKYGHYLVNQDREVFTKYRTKATRARRPLWHFTFQPDEVSAVYDAVARGQHVFVCLICADKTVCLLDSADFSALLKKDQPQSQYVRVSSPKGTSCRVSSTFHDLDHVIPHKAFPEAIFR